jgi:hypothetical protein
MFTVKILVPHFKSTRNITKEYGASTLLKDIKADILRDVCYLHFAFKFSCCLHLDESFRCT